MVFSPSNPVFLICKDAAGIAVRSFNAWNEAFCESSNIDVEFCCRKRIVASKITELQQCINSSFTWNIFAFGLFVSPIHTFRRIMRNRATEEFSGLPYIYALLNCLISMWYGSPIISPDNIMVMTVNSVGAVFQLVYIALFIIYAEKTKKMKMLGLLAAVCGLIAIIVYGSLQIADAAIRQLVVGVLSCASLISMFASPLFIINLVIRTKSVEFMPFYLSLSTFLMSTSFLLYGIFNCDLFVYVPNGVGTILGIVQLALYFHYKDSSKGNSREPLIVSYA